MNRSEIHAALSALGEHLQARGVVADLYLVGGAAMALAYDDRRSTRDIDAIFVPKMVVYEAAAQVADERGLPQGWLNDGVKGFMLGTRSLPDRGARSAGPAGGGGQPADSPGDEVPCAPHR